MGNRGGARSNSGRMRISSLSALELLYLSDLVQQFEITENQIEEENKQELIRRIRHMAELQIKRGVNGKNISFGHRDNWT